MSRHRPVVVTLAAAGLILASVGAAPAATAAPPGFTPIASGFAGPLHVAFGPGNSLYVADGFAGSVAKVDLASGATRTLLSVPGFAPGVDVQGNGNVMFTYSQGDGPESQGPAWLSRANASGRSHHVADMLAIEREYNPDGQVPVPGADAESNPYGVLALPGRTLVVDAAGNSLIEIRANGKVRVLTHFPEFAADGCHQNNPPLGVVCDAVPTDVELGPDGYLYVSGLGAEVEGHLYKVDASTGEIVQTWGGMWPLTGVAVAPDGTIYTSSVIAGFAGAPSTVWKISGGSVTSAFVPVPTDVEWGHGMLVAASLAGMVVKIDPAAFG